MVLRLAPAHWTTPVKAEGCKAKGFGPCALDSKLRGADTGSRPRGARPKVGNRAHTKMDYFILEHGFWFCVFLMDVYFRKKKVLRAKQILKFSRAPKALLLYLLGQASCSEPSNAHGPKFSGSLMLGRACSHLKEGQENARAVLGPAIVGAVLGKNCN